MNKKLKTLIYVILIIIEILVSIAINPLTLLFYFVALNIGRIKFAIGIFIYAILMMFLYITVSSFVHFLESLDEK